MTLSRPAVQHAVNKVCQRFQESTEGHLLRYLKGKIDYGVHFPHRSTLTLNGFYDADWGVI